MTQRWSLAVITVLALAATTKSAMADDKTQAKGTKVGYDVYNSYFESNKSGLKGDVSFLAFSDTKAFDQVFGPAAVMRKKPKFLPKDAFQSKVVVAVIHRGNKVWHYDVEKVTAENGTLYLQYRAKAQGGGGATFASPLIVAADKGNYSSVVFIENGKQVGTAKVGE